MKLYCYYTKSHLKMFNSFLYKSIKNFNEYELISCYGPQICEDGGFTSKDFTITTNRKMEFMLEQCDWESNEIVLFSDADVIFTNKSKDYILSEIKGNDIVFQEDRKTCNAGFYACKCNSIIKKLFEESVKLKTHYHNEQLALNSIINHYDVKYKWFDSKIWNISFLENEWDKSSKIEFPSDMMVFHANYMVGCDIKEKSLQIAQDMFF